MTWRHQSSEDIIQQAETKFNSLTKQSSTVFAKADTMSLRTPAPWEDGVQLSADKILDAFKAWSKNTVSDRIQDGVFHVLLTTQLPQEESSVSKFGSFSPGEPAFGIINASTFSYKVLGSRIATSLAISMGIQISYNSTTVQECEDSTESVFHNAELVALNETYDDVATWSFCASYDLEAWLENDSSAFEILQIASCGNGIVDAGEDCDCIGSECDHCCDLSTCTFYKDAYCSSLDSCCNDTCQIKTAGEICRPSGSSFVCDPVERCDGANSVCPSDIQLPIGSACVDLNGLEGTCYGVQCIASADAHCIALGFLGSCIKPGNCESITCYLEEEQSASGFQYCYPIHKDMPDGIECDSNSICLENTCVPEYAAKIEPPYCMDEIKEYEETDVDCGGSECRPCDMLQSCSSNYDCFALESDEALICKSDQCQIEAQSKASNGVDWKSKYTAILTIAGVFASLIVIALFLVTRAEACHLLQPNFVECNSAPDRRRRVSLGQRAPALVFPLAIQRHYTERRKTKQKHTEEMVENEQPELVENWTCPQCLSLNLSESLVCKNCNQDSLPSPIFVTHVDITPRSSPPRSPVLLEEYQERASPRSPLGLHIPFSVSIGGKPLQGDSESPSERVQEASVIVTECQDGRSSTTRVFLEDSDDDAFDINDVHPMTS